MRKCECGNDTFIPIVKIVSNDEKRDFAGDIIYNFYNWNMLYVGLKCMKCGKEVLR